MALEPMGYQQSGDASGVLGWSGLNLLAGVWLIISPFVLGYTSSDASWNPIVFGAIVAGLALVRMLAAAYTEAALLSLINVGVLGIVVFFLGMLSVAASGERTRVVA